MEIEEEEEVMVDIEVVARRLSGKEVVVLMVVEKEVVLVDVEVVLRRRRMRRLHYPQMAAGSRGAGVEKVEEGGRLQAAESRGRKGKREEGGTEGETEGGRDGGLVGIS